MNIRKKDGITLIALIITVIVMLILASVAIGSINGGLIDKVKQATAKYNNSVNTEDDTINNAIGWFDNVNGGESGEISNETPIAAPEVSGPSSTQTGGNITQSTGVIEIAWLDMNNNVIANPLPPTPNMTSDMQPIKWNGTTEENAGTYNNPDSDWYSYTAQTGATDGQTSNWANAITTTDGSYWVWIPRYAYRIVYFDSIDHANDYRENGYTETNKTWIQGYSTVYGMIDASGNVVDGTTPNINSADRVQTVGYTDYIPHPAFLGTGYVDLGGGFGDTKGISGFWVAKFEASGETNGSPSTPGNVVTSSTVKAVSKPEWSSWVTITIGNCYTNSFNYDTSKTSHLIKNSEWGAIAYLTDSKYGRNGTEVTVNNYFVGSKPKTGCAGGTISSAQDTTGSNSYLYNTTQGVLASTTGNITGVYDLNGGASEYVAAFNKVSTPGTISAYGSSFASANGNSTKYATAYSNSTGQSWATILANFTNIGSVAIDVSHIGDGIHEVWVNGNCGWFSDYSTFFNLGSPFFARGGSPIEGSGAGVFCAYSVQYR